MVRDALADGHWGAAGGEVEGTNARRLVRQLGGARAQLRDAMAEGGVTPGGAVSALEGVLR